MVAGLAALDLVRADAVYVRSKDHTPERNCEIKKNTFDYTRQNAVPRAAEKFIATLRSVQFVFASEES